MGEDRYNIGKEGSEIGEISGYKNFIKTGINGLDVLIKGFPKGGLIVVAGNPGTGKTAFSSSFIYNGIIKFNEPGVYTSLIEDEESFYQYMLEFGYDFKEFERRNLFKYIPMPTLLEPGIISFLDFMIEAVESIKARRLVIDSFTALSQMFKNKAEARTFLHTLFSKIVKRLECTTILIKEEPDVSGKGDYGYEEFIADGVIVLKTDRVEDKLIREMTILKMRGSAIRTLDSCFTLYNGFNVLLTTEFPKLFKHFRVTPPLDKEASYSTGIPDLDEIIGGYSKGSTVLLEIQPKVSRGQYRTIVWPSTASFILKGSPAITIPGMSSTLKDIDMFNEAFAVSEEERLKLTRCFLPKAVVGEPFHKYVVTYDPVDGGEVFIRKIEETAESLLKNIGKPPIITLSLDSIEFNYTYEDTLRIISRISLWVRKNDALLLLLDKYCFPEITSRIAPTATIHLKLMRRHGCLMLFGVKPRTPLYAVQPSTDNPIPNLIPIL